MLAVAVNRAEPSALDDLRSSLSALPSAAGVPVWAIPEDEELVAPLLQTVLEAAGATLVMGDPALLDRTVRGTVVAAMSLENVLPRLVEGGVVIVPGDRSDVLVGTVVAHLSHTFPMLAGIIVNGGFPIAPAIQRLLEGLGSTLPIAACPADTYETAVNVTRARSRFAADSPQKYARAVALFEQNVDVAELPRLLSIPESTVMTPLRFEQLLVERARERPRHIVLPEGDDDRILTAAATVSQRRIAELTILGDETKIRARAAELGLELDAVRVVSTSDPTLHERFAAEYARLRAHKGISAEFASDTVTDVSYFGTMMVHLGLADGMVSGAPHTTAAHHPSGVRDRQDPPGRLGRLERVPDGARRPRAGLRRLRRHPGAHDRAARRHRHLVRGHRSTSSASSRASRC